jgi:AbrB family looped-hinge helix DNA binding protein
MYNMKAKSSTFTSKGQLVVPAELRHKHGIEAGTKVKFLEDQFGRIVLQPLTEEYVDRVMGCLANGPDLLTNWEKEHRSEVERDK